MKENEALREKVSLQSVQPLSKPKGTTCDIQICLVTVQYFIEYTVMCSLLSN